MRIFDCDVHIHETPADLAPFCEEPWRRALASETPKARVHDVPGYSPLTQLDPPWGDAPVHEPYVVHTANQLRADLDRRGVDSALMITDRFIGLAVANDEDYAVSIARAYNRYLRERWLDPLRGLHGAILAAPQDPAAAAREIDAYAGVPGVAAVLLSTVHTSPLWGDRSYEPIFAAAGAADLPLVLHGATTYGNVFPYQLHSFQSPLARGALSQPLGAVANLVSLVTNGVLARHPRLRVLFCEAGLAWLPLTCARLDQQWAHMRASAPDLELAPSAYVRRQVWVTTHPWGPIDARLVDLVGPDRIVFGSDWPHFDRDEPAAVAGALPVSSRAAIMSENARALLQVSAQVGSPPSGAA